MNPPAAETAADMKINRPVPSIVITDEPPSRDADEETAVSE